MPWYFPSPPDQTAPPCDPWQSKEFLNFMSTVPDNKCEDCLPDCITTIYKSSATSAEFRRCDEKNAGNSLLCSLEPDLVAVPPIWGQDVKEDYGNSFGAMPNYVKDGRWSETNKRRYKNFENLLMTELMYFSTFGIYSREILF